MKHTNLLTQADKDTFDRIDRDCLAMHVCPPPKTFLKLEVRDGAGELTDIYEDRAHSWVRNAYSILYPNLLGINLNIAGETYGEGLLTVKNVAGTVLGGAQLVLGAARASTGYPNLAMTGAAGAASGGIVVGTGSGAEAFDDTGLASLVANGVSAGQISYSAQNTPTAIYSSPSKKWTVTWNRIFNNNSGGSIVISEVGVYGNFIYNSTPQPIMVCRDLLASAVTVPNAGQLTVTYTIEMTFPG